jgi:hypothetical protein
MQVSTCLVDAYEDYNCFGEVCFFRRIEGFKIEQSSTCKFCVNLKKTSTELLEMLKSAYGEECFPGTTVFEWCIRFLEGLKK